MTISDPGRPPARTIGCAHCKVTFHSVVEMYEIGKEERSSWITEKQVCAKCSKLNLFLVNSTVYHMHKLERYLEDNVLSRHQIRPRGTNRAPLSPEVPALYAEDYRRACLVLGG
jgi:hypothetical protein